MTDVELRLTADLGQATKEVAGFRKEYQEMVKAVEKPLRQVDALQKTQESAKAASTAYFQAKHRVEQLRDAFQQAGQPVKGLSAELNKAERTLARATLEFDRQKAKVREQRAELRAAGVDTRNLANEQQRLASELNSALAAGRNDQATAGIRARAAALAQVTREQRSANIEAARENLGVNRHRALQAEIQRATQQYEQLRRSGKLTAQELAVAQQQLTQRIRESKQALKELAGQQSGGSILAEVGGRVGVGGGVAAGVVGGVALAAQYASAVDPIKQMNAQLKLATTSQEEFAQAQRDAARIAELAQTPLTDTATLYARLAPPLRDVGRSQQDAANVTEAFALGLKISGSSAQSAAGAIQQFSQAMGAGVLRGEEYNSVVDGNIRLIRAMAEELGITVGQFREMAFNGEITAEVLADLSERVLPKLREEVESMPDTWGGAVTRLNNSFQTLIGKFDDATGVSGRLIDKINSLTGAINLLASGTGEKAVAGVASLSLELARLVPMVDLAFSASERLMAMLGIQTAAARLKEMAKKEGEALTDRKTQFDMRAAEMKALQKRAADDSKEILDQQVKDTEAALKNQVAAERKAASDLEKAKQAQLDTQKRYQEALANLNAGAGGEASYGQAESLKVAARSALRSGDVEGAKRQAQAALAVLEELAQAGENTYGFEGFIKELQAIEDAADQRGVDETRKSLEQAREAAAQTKAALDELKDVKVAPTLDQEAQQKLLNDLAALAKKAGVLLTIPATVTVQGGGLDFTQPYTLVDPGPAPGYATGGSIRGPGTGTSDSILMWGSNGEFMQPAAAVQYYGKDFMEAIRQRRLPKFADGGLISNRSLPQIPQMSPSLLASGGGGEPFAIVNADLGGGQTFTARVDQDNFDKLLRIERRKRGSPRRKT